MKFIDQLCFDKLYLVAEQSKNSEFIIDRGHIIPKTNINFVMRIQLYIALKFVIL